MLGLILGGNTVYLSDGASDFTVDVESVSHRRVTSWHGLWTLPSTQMLIYARDPCDSIPSFKPLKSPLVRGVTHFNFSGARHYSEVQLDVNKSPTEPPPPIQKCNKGQESNCFFSGSIVGFIF